MNVGGRLGGLDLALNQLALDLAQGAALASVEGLAALVLALDLAQRVALEGPAALVLPSAGRCHDLSVGLPGVLLPAPGRHVRAGLRRWRALRGAGRGRDGRAR